MAMPRESQAGKAAVAGLSRSSLVRRDRWFGTFLSSTLVFLAVPGEVDASNVSHPNFRDGEWNPKVAVLVKATTSTFTLYPNSLFTFHIIYHWTVIDILSSLFKEPCAES
ncbi:uncharacterized protein ARMOST_17616 [Armillaria ostoyae]|uniref:Uncharacterized protein n=1 Tax=Armillaria ostoyae TaxID=47428 RepID=A0A284RZG6_ARMOS|nr:uncharacterized protein ARMOST_17616 [Armillaria ostoyae]